MGFRYRKSINLGGGFRVNLSKSGIGYSWGTNGVRVTKTATGKTRNTLSIPGTGISYVTESSSKKSAHQQTSHKVKNNSKYANATDNLSYDNLDSGIYNEAINEVIKYKKISGILFALSIFSFIIALFFPLLFIVSIISFITSIVLTLTRGRLKIEYELDEATTKKYNELCSSWKRAFDSLEIWQISQTCITNDKKDNCGAKSAIKPITIRKQYFKSILPDVITNITPLCVPIIDDKEKKIGQIIILPDRVIISKGAILVAVEHKYITTNVSIQPTAIPNGKYPNDARVVEKKYLHENNDGTPDMRYKDNPILPVVHYGRVDVETNGSTILSLLFSNLSIIEQVENKLSIENLTNYSLDEHIEQSTHTVEEKELLQKSNTTDIQNTIEQKAHNEAENKISTSSEDLRKAQEDYRQAKEELSETFAQIKQNYNKKKFSPKQIKFIFLIAVAIATVLSLILVVAMHSQGDEVSTDVFMFIFCTIVLSVPTLLGALIICIPSIKNNRKNK